MKKDRPLTADEIVAPFCKRIGELMKKLPVPKEGPTFEFRDSKFVKLEDKA